MRDLEFNIRAKDRTREAFDQAQRNADRFSGRLDVTRLAFAGLSSAARGFAAGLTLTAVTGYISATAQKMNDLAAAAKTAGVGVEVLQELAYAARFADVSSDALVDGLKEMQLRADELVKTAGGPAKEAFAALGYDASILADRLREPDKLFEDIIRRMRDLDTAAQIRVADEIFGGTAGEQFVRFLDEANMELDTARKRVRDVGGVIDAELVGKSRALGKLLDEMWFGFEASSNAAIVKVSAGLYDLITLAREFSSEYQGRLQGMELGAEVGRMAANPPARRPGGPAVDLARRGGRVGEQTMDQAQAAFDAARQDARLSLVFGDRYDGKGALAHSGRGAAGASRKPEIDEYQRVMDKLREESQLIRLNEVDQRILVEQRRAGVSAASDQGKAIEALVRRNEAEMESLKRLEDAQRDFNDSVEYLQDVGFDGLWGIVSGAEDAEDALKRMVAELARAAAYAALFKRGPLAGLFGGGGGGGSGGGFLGTLLGGIFGGFRAGGGPVDPWSSYVVGERGPEILRMGGQGGTIVPNGGGGAGGGGQAQLLMGDIRVSVDGEGNVKAYVERMGLQAVGVAVQTVRQQLPSMQASRQSFGR